MNKPTRWPVLIIALLAGFAMLSLWSFRRAAMESSAVTDADYYSHGLRYNQTLLEQQAAATLGWQIRPRLEGHVVTIQLSDHKNRQVGGALGMLHLLGEGDRYSRGFPLSEVGTGAYQTEIPEEFRGDQAAEVSFQRDGARLSQRLLLAIR